jgi:hypothetical protein
MLETHDGPPAETLARLDRLYGPDCPLRIRFFVPFAALADVAAMADRTACAGRVRIAGVKAFLDGSLGSRTAWFFEPYLTPSPRHPHPAQRADLSLGGRGVNSSSANLGFCTLDPQELRRQIAAANRAGLPFCVHAIGDRACAEALDAFEARGERDIGNRIEHAQHLRPADIPRFAAAGVAASVQPIHLASDWQATDRLLGPDRARWTYPFRSLLEAGAVLAIGSDAPVASPALAGSFQAAVLRQDGQGRPDGGWYPREGITPEAWAAAASRGAWQSIGEGSQQGRLEPGMACDLTILEGELAASEDGHAAFTPAGTVVESRSIGQSVNPSIG